MAFVFNSVLFVKLGGKNKQNTKSSYESQDGGEGGIEDLRKRGKVSSGHLKEWGNKHARKCIM